MLNKNKEVFTEIDRKTLKSTLVTCFIVLVVVLCIDFFTGSMFTGKSKTVGVIQDQSLGIVKIEDKSAPYIDINAEYPTEGTGSLYVAKQVEKIIQEFKTSFDFSNATKQELEDQGLFDDRRYQLYITYSAISGPHTISHRVTSYVFTGGAHGNTFIETYTFNAQEKLLFMSDIFIDKTKALEILSKKSVEYIKNNPEYKDAIDEAWLAEGTTPIEENFAAFEINKDTFGIVFQQYQVAAYVYGNIEVRIPLSDLSDVLKPEFK